MRGHLRLGSQKALIVCCGAKCGTLVNWRPGGRPAGTTDFCQTQIRSRREKFVRRIQFQPLVALLMAPVEIR
jgi:hypothetical protein